MSENKSNFTTDMTKAINYAFGFAIKKRYEFVTVDNLMLFVSNTPRGKEIFTAVGVNLEDYRQQVTNYLDENNPKFSKLSKTEQPIQTVQLNKLIDHAHTLQRVNRNTKTNEEDIFYSLFLLSKEESFTLNYFNHYSIKRFDFVSYLVNGKKRTQVKKIEKDTKEESTSFLDKYAILLNSKALKQKIDPLIGRTEEIEKVIEILAQKKKNNPILVGDPGVGKTAIAEGFARKIVEGTVPTMFKNSLIYSLDLNSLVAGSKFRGDFEEKLKCVIKESMNENVILFIDEIHTIIGAGSSNGTMDASNILKPYLSSGDIRVIGATTYEEYRKYFEKESALARRFHKIDIIEPNAKETMEILNGVKVHYEIFHKVKYEQSALDAAINLTEKYITDKKFPDKAIDVLDMAGAKAKVKKIKGVITSKEISSIIAKMANIPVSEIEETDKDKLKSLSITLKNKVFGQEDAIQTVVNNIILSRASFINKNKPIGSFLFAGPSGVGKTELAKEIANNLNIPLIRFDMSEYMEGHSVSKLIGTAPGYVGFSQGGKLIDSIRKSPHAVLLLDEIEKAHPDVFNILLQVMDYATLTDNSGQKADFKNIVLIMTSNTGGTEINKKSIGFNNQKNIIDERDKKVKKLFAPEFCSRLDSIIHFNSLNNDVVIKVVEKHLKNLQDQLNEKRVILSYDKNLVDFIANKGFDESLGARPIERFIEQHISQILAPEIIFGKLEKGGEIIISASDSINIEYIHCYNQDIDDLDIVKNVLNIIDKGLSNQTLKNRKKTPRKIKDNLLMN